MSAAMFLYIEALRKLMTWYPRQLYQRDRYQGVSRNHAANASGMKRWSFGLVIYTFGKITASICFWISLSRIRLKCFRIAFGNV
jgi:hypothetical protein